MNGSSGKIGFGDVVESLNRLDRTPADAMDIAVLERWIDQQIRETGRLEEALYMYKVITDVQEKLLTGYFRG